MDSTEVFCPAKINLILAVTGQRPDGFHELISLMAPLDWGDRLALSWREKGDENLFTCSHPALPSGEDNLVMRAVGGFSRSFPLDRGLRVHLTKNIPVGAGLGGGSSDAAGALAALNRLCGNPFSPLGLRGLAAEIGSDCPFFLTGGPAVVRGRGEILEEPTPAIRNRLRGLRILLCKPFFGVSTAWAFSALSRQPDQWSSPEEAENRLKTWEAPSPCAWRYLLHNDFEPVVHAKYIPLAVMKRELEEQFDAAVLMSGSGSALFAVIENPRQEKAMRDHILQSYGPEAFLATASIGEGDLFQSMD